jgi:hypothetical protein
MSKDLTDTRKAAAKIATARKSPRYWGAHMNKAGKLDLPQAVRSAIEDIEKAGIDTLQNPLSGSATHAMAVFLVRRVEPLVAMKQEDLARLALIKASKYAPAQGPFRNEIKEIANRFGFGPPQ